MKTFKITIFIFLIMIAVSLTPVPGAAKWQNPTDNLQVSIPNLRFSPPQCDDNGCRTTWISEYIAAIYKYAIGIVGILAVVVMMIGGISWMVAGGNASRIGEAKAWIGAALTGLLLTLSSYIILVQINPKIVMQSGRLSIKKITTGDAENNNTASTANSYNNYAKFKKNISALAAAAQVPPLSADAVYAINTMEKTADNALNGLPPESSNPIFNALIRNTEPVEAYFNAHFTPQIQNLELQIAKANANSLNKITNDAITKTGPQNRLPSAAKAIEINAGIQQDIVNSNILTSIQKIDSLQTAYSNAQTQQAVANAQADFTDDQFKAIENSFIMFSQTEKELAGIFDQNSADQLSSASAELANDINNHITAGPNYNLDCISIIQVRFTSSSNTIINKNRLPNTDEAGCRSYCDNARTMVVNDPLMTLISFQCFTLRVTAS